MNFCCHFNADERHFSNAIEIPSFSNKRTTDNHSMDHPDAKDEHPQNPLTRQIYLVHPKDAFLTELGISAGHPAAEVTAILTPRLRYETYFEGWAAQWRKKAKTDFITSFVGLWSSPYSSIEHFPPDSLTLLSEFLAALKTASDPVKAFDTWWTLQERIDLVEIDQDWRPS